MRSAGGDPLAAPTRPMPPNGDFVRSGRGAAAAGVGAGTDRRIGELDVAARALAARARPRRAFEGGGVARRASREADHALVVLADVVVAAREVVRTVAVGAE